MRVWKVSFQCFPSTPLPLKKQAIAAMAHRFGQGSQPPARSCALRMVWKRGHPMISRVITIFHMTIFWINKPWQLISLQTLPFDCWTNILIYFTLSDYKTEFKSHKHESTTGKCTAPTSCDVANTAIPIHHPCPMTCCCAITMPAQVDTFSHLAAEFCSDQMRLRETFYKT